MVGSVPEDAGTTTNNNAEDNGRPAIVEVLIELTHIPP